MPFTIHIFQADHDGDDDDHDEHDDDHDEYLIGLASLKIFWSSNWQTLLPDFLLFKRFWPTAKYSPVHSIHPQSHCLSLFRYVLKADTHQMRHSLSVFKWGEDFPERKDLETRVAVHPWSVYALFWEPVKNGTNFARGCNTRTTRASKHCTKCTLCTLNCTPGWCSYCTFFCTNYIARKAHKIEDPNARHDRKGDKMQAPVWTCQILQIMRALVRRNKSLTALHISLHMPCFLLICCATRTTSNIAIWSLKYVVSRNANPYTISKS